KLLSILENRQLLFARADQFDDPYEGAWSSAGVTLLRDPKWNGGMLPHAVETFIALAETMRRQTFLNCWCASEHESAAMWKLYLQSSEGVAIRTDHDALGRSLEQSSLSVRTTMGR